jgi:hypothetical protein
MGQINFRIPARLKFEKRTANTVHVIGLDGIPWPCKISFVDDILCIERNRDESGHVFVVYPFDDFGELVVSTGTLVETPVPYHLTLELARGTLNRLRNQLSIWEEGGLSADAQVHELLQAATGSLAAAIMSAEPVVTDCEAHQALVLGMQATFLLCQRFATDVLPLRAEQLRAPRFWLAVQADDEALEKVQPSLDFVDLVQLETVEQRHQSLNNVILGPMLDAAAGGMKTSWAETDNFDEKQSAILRDCREKLRGPLENVKLIHVVAGINGMGHRHLSYPQQLQITMELLQMVENSGVQIPTMVSFDTPWAERLAWSVGGVHPLQIADSLLRRGVSLSIIGLDINLDYWPNGSLPRDPTQWIDLVDMWSQLGIPLVIRLSAPTVVKGIVASTTNRTINSVRESMTDPQCLHLIETVIPTILARPMVHGIVWTQLVDNFDPRFPYAGLFGADGQRKAIVDSVSRWFK